MKKMIKIMLGTIAGVAFAATAMALPLIPSIPDDEPLFFKFNNKEQISPTGQILTPDGNLEQNWGTLTVTTVANGDLSNLPTSVINVVDSQLFNRDNTIPGQHWALGFSPGEITGIFYGIKPDAANLVDPIASTGGFMDLYFDATPDYSNTLVPANRLTDSTYVGATDGTFLARIAFLNGAISVNSATTSIVGSVVPSPTGFTEGSADSFGSIVADVDGDGILYEPIDDGAWAKNLDTNWFDTLLGNNTADFRFKNSYNPDSTWNGIGADGLPIIGATSDDPARAYSQPIPEPASMLLLGTGLAGLAGIGRRRRKK